MDDTQLRPMHDDPSLMAIKPTHSTPTEIISGLNFANFNQDYSCISVGYENGFRVYNCEPFTQCYEHIDGSIGIVEMLFCSSLLAIVGTGEQASLSPRRLKIINTKRHTTICELTFPTSILSIRMNRERLIVLLEEIIYIYDITNMRLLHTVEIPPNPTGLIVLSLNTNNNYLAYPSPQKISKLSSNNNNNNNNNSNNNGNSSINSTTNINNGTSIKNIGNNIQSNIDVTSINGLHPIIQGDSHDDLVALHDSANVTQSVRNGDVIIFDCKSLQPITVIDAHKTQLAAMAFSHDGTLLATASDKGTIVRVFSVERGVKLYQFRRGTYNTKIYSLAFSPSNMFLIASSATGTVHVFRLGEEEAKNTVIRSNGSSGWLNSKKNDFDRNLEVTRQSELDKLMKNQQAKMDSLESLDLDDNQNNNQSNDDVNTSDFNRLRIHSDSEDDLDSLDEGEEDTESNDRNINNNSNDSNYSNDYNDNENNNNNNNNESKKKPNHEENFESIDVLRPLQSDLNNESNNIGSTTDNFTDLNNLNNPTLSVAANNSSTPVKIQPVVDKQRRSVARMFRRTSQSLGRKAAEKMGNYLPPRFSSILEPNRHFASFKVPTNKENMTIVGVIESSVDSSEQNEDSSYQSIAAHNLDDSSSTHSLNSGVSNISFGSRGNNSRSNSRRKKVVHILVVSADGMFYTYKLDPDRGGDCVLVSQHSLLE